MCADDMHIIFRILRYLTDFKNNYLVLDGIFCIEDIMFQIIYILHMPNLNISHILASSFMSRSFDFLVHQNYYPNTTHITRVTSLESSDTITLSRKDLIL